ncbi:MAG: transcriptional regulator [Actinobacteria bacterium ATB1]|nr:transcriptional regulator [Actinobacteria bacterium ATB1]
MSTTYAQRVGDRLRNIRKQKGLSLQDVEAQSSQEFKASVLGAYERGERAISVPRLHKLAQFYDVPAEQLLPAEPGVRRGEVPIPGGVTLDLTRLNDLDGSELEPVGRYVSMIQVQRQDFNGRVLTIRRDDLRALACLYEMSSDELESRLHELGVTDVPV